jgi:predicted lipoprotein
MRCALSWLGATVIVASLCWLFPPFHVVPLRDARQQQQRGVFNAATFAAAFWDNQLLPAAGQATLATEVLSALAHDPEAARKRFGHSPGLSAGCYFFVKGSGQITAIEKEGIRIALVGAEIKASVQLHTGLLFGNSLRDATGLLNISDFPNSQDFNDLSAELNRLVETRVLPELRERAAVGKIILFVGCIELTDAATPEVFEVVPVKADWQ